MVRTVLLYPPHKTFPTGTRSRFVMGIVTKLTHGSRKKEERLKGEEKDLSAKGKKAIPMEKSQA